MKTRIAAALASLLVASMGAAAYAQTTPQQTTPQQTMPQPASTSAQSDQMSGQSSNGMESSGNMEDKIKHALTAHGVTATDVQVSFSNGTATLTGTVYNHRDINKAKRAAMRVHGVKHVDVSGLQAKSAQSSAPASASS